MYDACYQKLVSKLQMKMKGERGQVTGGGEMNTVKGEGHKIMREGEKGGRLYIIDFWIPIWELESLL